MQSIKYAANIISMVTQVTQTDSEAFIESFSNNKIIFIKFKCLKHYTLLPSLHVIARRRVVPQTYLWLRPKTFNGLNDLSLVGPAGVQLLDLFCSSTSMLALLLRSHLISSQ